MSPRPTGDAAHKAWRGHFAQVWSGEEDESPMCVMVRELSTIVP